MSLVDEVVEVAARVRAHTPLVHNITNYVTVNDVANAELAIGGSALMADAVEELRDMVKIASAVNINIGTLNARTVESMHAAADAAAEFGRPLVFDPVGAGASALRNETTRAFLAHAHPACIRGNLSEIAFVAGLAATTRGVDAGEVDGAASPEEVAAQVARAHGCICAITGAVDVVSDGTHTILIENGDAAMGKITGTGCMCDGLIAAFLGAADADETGVGKTTDAADASETAGTRAALVACAAAICSMGLAGELARRDLEGMGALVGTGSLHIGIIDRLSLLSADDYRRHARIEER